MGDNGGWCRWQEGDGNGSSDLAARVDVAKGGRVDVNRSAADNTHEELTVTVETGMKKGNSRSRGYIGTNSHCYRKKVHAAGGCIHSNTCCNRRQHIE